MGHGMCGGCHAALHRTMDGAEPGRGGFIADWIAVLDEASAGVRAEFPDYANREAGRAMELAGVKVSLANLRTFPCIPELRSEEHTSELQSLMRISYDDFVLTQ